MQFNKLIPELSVTNIEISKRFYVSKLGFKIEYERPENGFAFLSLGEAQIMIEQINGHWKTAELKSPFGRGINFQIQISNPELLYEKLKNEKTPFFRDLSVSRYMTPNGLEEQKEFLVQDPDGYLLRFCD